MQKILVTGNAGAGKSTFSRQVADRLDLPVYSLDSIVWQPGWKKTPDAEKRKKIAELTNRPQWVIDGVSSDVFKAADTVVFLDFPRRVCYWRAFKRNWRYLFTSRPELPENCPEILIIRKLLTIIWTFHTNYRPQLLEAMAHAGEGKRIVHIRSNAELGEFLNGLHQLPRK